MGKVSVDDEMRIRHCVSKDWDIVQLRRNT